jgi:hypothetical protein
MSSFSPPIIPNSSSVRSEAVNILVQQLGLGKAALFIRENLSQPTDYLELKEQLFGEMTVDQISQEIQRQQQT